MVVKVVSDLEIPYQVSTDVLSLFSCQGSKTVLS